MSEEINPFNKLLVKVGNELLPDDLEGMKLLATGKIERGKLHDTTTGVQLLHLLHSEELVSPSNLSFLKSLLQNVQRIDLLNTVNKFNEFGDTSSVLDVVASNKLLGVNLLLKNAATLDKNLRNKDGETALHVAVIKADVDIFQVLVDAGFDINATDSKNWTVLRRAVYRERLDIIRILIQQGVNINQDPLEEPMFLAISNYNRIMREKEDERLSICRELLKGGSNPKSKDENGETFLSYATRIDVPTELIELLIEVGCDIDQKGRKGSTPLYNLAAGCGLFSTEKIEVIKMLVGKGCDVNAIGDQNDTVWHRGMGRSLECIETLFSSPIVDPNITNDDGENALHTAVGVDSTRRLQVVKIVLETGKVKDIDARDNDGYTPLLRAATSHLGVLCEVVHELEKAGCDMKASTIKQGYTILHILVNRMTYDWRTKCYVYKITNEIEETLSQLRKLDSVKGLLNIQDKEGNTPLHHVLQHSHPGCVRILLDMKPDLTIINKYGQTIFDLKTKDEKIVHMLEQEKKKLENNSDYQNILKQMEDLRCAITRDDRFLNKEEAVGHIEALEDILRQQVGVVTCGMLPKDREVLDRQRVILVDEMEPGMLISYLIQYGVITAALKEEVDAEPTRRKKCDKLLDMLPRRGANAFKYFCQALRESGQGHVADVLEQKD